MFFHFETESVDKRFKFHQLVLIILNEELNYAGMTGEIENCCFRPKSYPTVK